MLSLPMLMLHLPRLLLLQYKPKIPGILCIVPMRTNLKQEFSSCETDWIASLKTLVQWKIISIKFDHFMMNLQLLVHLYRLRNSLLKLSVVLDLIFENSLPLFELEIQQFPMRSFKKTFGSRDFIEV